MVTLENEKFKGDKNRQGLRCSFKGCDFITSITKKCKARKKIKIHEEKHKKEEKALIETDETTIVETEVQTTIAENTIDAKNSKIEHTLLTNAGYNGANGSTGDDAGGGIGSILDDAGEDDDNHASLPVNHETTCGLCGHFFLTDDDENPDDNLPDMDCGFEAYNGQMLGEHIKKEHPNVGWFNAQDLFREMLGQDISEKSKDTVIAI